MNGVGVEELLKEDDVLIFPNPTSDKLIISLKDNSYSEKTIRCFDVLGNEIVLIETFDKIIQIDVSSFSKGIYFIELQNKPSKQKITKKIIVQ